jgi:hypothetical protein
MCARKICPTCQRPTFAGCGMHVEQVLSDVPPDERCQCDQNGGRRKGRWFTRR